MVDNAFTMLGMATLIMLVSKVDMNVINTRSKRIRFLFVSERSSDGFTGVFLSLQTAGSRNGEFSKQLPTTSAAEYNYSIPTGQNRQLKETD